MPGWKTIALSLSVVATIAACDSPTDLSESPSSAIRSDVRFRAAAARTGEPRVVTIELELLNTTTSHRQLTWGGCGIGLRLFRNGSLAYEPPIAPCDDVLHMTGLEPAQQRTLTSETYIDTSRVLAGSYQVIVIFKGEINGEKVEVAVAAGDITF